MVLSCESFCLFKCPIIEKTVPRSLKPLQELEETESGKQNSDKTPASPGRGQMIRSPTTQNLTGLDDSAPIQCLSDHPAGEETRGDFKAIMSIFFFFDVLLATIEIPSE